MKKFIFSILFFLHLFLFSNAQEKRINLYGGYVFDDKFESYYDSYDYYNGKIKGGFQYGVGIELKNFSDFGFELLYIGQSTTASTYYYDTTDRNTVFDLNFNYGLAAFNKYFGKEESKYEGYLGFMLGALFANARNPETDLSNDATKFSWGVRMGSNYWLSEKIGVRLHAQLLSSIQTAGGELYFGSGGVTKGSTTTSSMLQFSINSGLIFRFVKDEQ